MHDTAFVTSIQDEKITVVPLIKGACLSCKQGCAKRGNPFEVINPNKFPVKINSIVKIGTSRKKELSQALSSILFPVLCAFIFYFGISFLEIKTGKNFIDGIKAASALSGFVFGAAISFFAAKNKKIAQPEITELCS